MFENSTIPDTTGKTYKKFTTTKYLPLPELNAVLVKLVHEPTNAQVIQIANDDSENLFCLSFQTLPSSSNGIAHVLEHIVLCGSQKFPVKDPFFAMTRRSLNTYMNALTGQDFTCYPAASQVEKDFYNLLEVYLDAIFYPNLKEVSFLQEGHRLEFIDPKNHQSPIQFQGVVYNEMKGAMSSAESRLWEALMKHLTPDLPYAHNSGGNPKEIPLLTLKELKKFHQEFYHPSRCLFFFYGNLPLSKHLNAIEPILNSSNRLNPLGPIPLQKRFKKPVKAIEYYPIEENESTQKKAQIAFGWLTAHVSEQIEILALCLIESILTDTDASFLTKALLESGLCAQVNSSIDTEMSEVPWVIVCKGCDQKDVSSLEKTLFDTLGKVHFSQKEIEAALHQLEFLRTEIGSEGIPFGLSLFFRSALIEQHGCSAENGLLIHTLFAKLRSHIQDPNYLPNLLKKRITDNPHFVCLTLIPDPNLAKKEKEQELQILQRIQKTLQKEKILKQMDQLKKYHEKIEHQSLKCLPKVTLKDVSQKSRDFPLSQDENIFFHQCFTNQILYLDLLFDLPEIEQEKLSLLSLLVKMIPELGSGGRDYEQTLIYQHSYIGSFDAILSLHVNRNNPNLCFPTLSLRGKVFERNRSKLFELFKDTVNEIDLDDTKRVQKWLVQHATELADHLPKAAMSYAIQSSLSQTSIPSYFYNQWHGLPYFQSVIKWIKEFDHTLIKSLKTLKSQVLEHQNYHLVMSCDEGEYQHLDRCNFYDLKKPSTPLQIFSTQYSIPKIDSQARLIAAPISFTSWGFKTISSTHELSAALLIAAELMENLVLHKEIREKGGAYGSGATYAPSTGNFNFYSYRDPHLCRTIDAFQLAIEKIKNQQFSARELEEAKLGVIQALDTPIAPGNRALLAFSWQRQNRPLKARQKFRNNVLNATAKKVSDSISEHLEKEKGTLACFLGKELFEKEKKTLKIPLECLSIESV